MFDDQKLQSTDLFDVCQKLVNSLNLQITHLKKECTVQAKVIQQLKTLYSSSLCKNAKYCDAGHLYCKIQHNRYNYVNPNVQDQDQKPAVIVKDRMSIQEKNERLIIKKMSKKIDILQSRYGTPSNLQLIGSILVSSVDTISIKTWEETSPKKKPKSKAHCYYRVPVLYSVQKTKPIAMSGSLLSGGNDTVSILSRSIPENFETMIENDEYSDSDDPTYSNSVLDGNCCDDVFVSTDDNSDDPEFTMNENGHNPGFTAAEIGSPLANLAEKKQQVRVNSEKFVAAATSEVVAYTDQDQCRSDVDDMENTCNADQSSDKCLDAVSVYSHTDDPPLDSECFEDGPGDNAYFDDDVYDNSDGDGCDDFDDNEVDNDECYEDDYEESEDW